MTGMALRPGQRWGGYAPSIIAQRHKYSIQYHPKLKWRIASTVEQRSPRARITLFCMDPHEEVIRQVPQGGPILINEYKQVLKPQMDGEFVRHVTYLGEFPDLHLRFRFEDRVYDGAQTEGLHPGDPWPHHEAGIIYRYDLKRQQVIRRRKVWTDYGAVEEDEGWGIVPDWLFPALKTAKRGQQAGRFYVNEHGAIFAPERDEDTSRMVYVGRLKLDAGDFWFPKWQG